MGCPPQGSLSWRTGEFWRLRGQSLSAEWLCSEATLGGTYRGSAGVFSHLSFISSSSVIREKFQSAHFVPCGVGLCGSPQAQRLKLQGARRLRLLPGELQISGGCVWSRESGQGEGKVPGRGSKLRNVAPKEEIRSLGVEKGPRRSDMWPLGLLGVFFVIFLVNLNTNRAKSRAQHMGGRKCDICPGGTRSPVSWLPWGPWRVQGTVEWGSGLGNCLTAGFIFGGRS